mmetsp:Transcript_24667/g.39096  ORF Transcript_24667/g.39096 Transcript_24667/m.39096 type:complete len:212 (-) Transcript_24667:508-1143(-)
MHDQRRCMHALLRGVAVAVLSAVAWISEFLRWSGIQVVGEGRWNGHPFMRDERALGNVGGLVMVALVVAVVMMVMITTAMAAVVAIVIHGGHFLWLRLRGNARHHIGGLLCMLQHHRMNPFGSHVLWLIVVTAAVVEIGVVHVGAQQVLVRHQRVSALSIWRTKLSRSNLVELKLLHILHEARHDEILVVLWHCVRHRRRCRAGCGRCCGC